MAYEKQEWKNGEDGNTPITADSLNHIEEGIAKKAKQGPEGPKGEQGPEGKAGPTGKEGPQGKTGPAGKDAEQQFTADEVDQIKALIEE